MAVREGSPFTQINKLRRAGNELHHAQKELPAARNELRLAPERIGRFLGMNTNGDWLGF
jgi:hypothetical protein